MSLTGSWDVMTRSKKNDHPTPQWLFNALNDEFKFELDACASADNAKCERYFSESCSFLNVPKVWFVDPVVTFMNPPYQNEETPCKPKCKKKACKPEGKRGYCITERIPGTGDFVEAAYLYSLRGATVVCLLPSRTGTAWFQDYALPFGEIRYLRGRLTFEGQKDPAPFDSIIVIFRPKDK